MPRVLKTSFNAGEFSPQLYGRYDLSSYDNGCKTMENFVCTPHGGATRRPGFRYIAETKTSTKHSRLIPFQYSTTQAYIIEAGHEYFRFCMDGFQLSGPDAYTLLLLHMDGADRSTTFLDSGATVHTVTPNNGPYIATGNNNAFPGGAARFWAASDQYLAVPDHADWHFDTNAWCIDFWYHGFAFNPTADMGFWGQRTDASNYHGLWFDFSELKIKYTVETGGSLVDRLEIAVAADYLHYDTGWIHIAVIDNWGGDSSKQALCLNGVAVDTYTAGALTVPNYTEAFYVGCAYDGTTWNYLDGSIDEFRVSNGSSRWTAAFTPPTSPYPNEDSGGGGDGVLEVATTYTSEEVGDLRYVQSADTLYIVHPDHAPAKLTRSSHTDWTLSTITLAWPAFLDINATAITLDPAAVTGTGIGVVASASFFESDHVGTYFAMSDGYFLITAVTDTTNAVATVISDLTAHTATANWYESIWSPRNGYPVAVTFHEDRLAFGGCASYPDRLDLSKTAEYENFARGAVEGATAAADDSIAITLLSREVNAIKWMASTRKLLIGTAGGEWWIEGSSSSEPLDATATSLVRMDSALGSAKVDPVIIGNDIIFLQKTSRVLREYGYTWEKDQYEGNDVSIVSEHLLHLGQITELAWQQTPHKICWAVRSDGELLGLTFMKEHKVVGWHKHPATGTSAAFESIATIEGDREDELYCIVKRTIDGSTVRNIEVLTPIVAVAPGFQTEESTNDYDLEDCFLVDSGLTYRGTAATVISGLDHLEGESVSVLADGVSLTKKVVASGAITLATAASVVHVGLGYNSNLELLDPVVRSSDATDVSQVQGIGKRVTNVILNLYRTVNGQIGPSSGVFDLMSIRYATGTSTTDFYTGYTEDTAIFGKADRTPNVYIRANEPLPMTILAAVLEVEV